MIWLLTLLGVLLAPPLDLALVSMGPSLWADPLARVLVVGALLGGTLGVVLSWRVPFLLVLDHEIAHLLAAMSCLRRPMGLRVGEETGLAEYSAGRGSALILLAPYVWPWTAWVLCALLSVVRGDLQAPVLVGVGAALGFSAVRIGLDLRPWQSDLQRLGLVRSAICVLAWAPLLFAIPVLFALGGLDQLVSWTEVGWKEAQALRSRFN